VSAAAVAVAFLFDALVGELPERGHPVALFGRLVGGLDREWRRPRLVGAAAAVGLPLLAAGLAGGATALAARLSPLAGVAVGALALTSAFSLRMLRSVAREVVDATRSDAEGAREAVRSLVGRDATALSAGELRSAAVESAAENLADGFVAPLSAFALGAGVSLSVGVAAAAWVKGVNTLDSMLGYRDTPVGWASARLDDAVMWLPARLTAALLAAAARDPGAVPRGRSWAREPASPNSGWPMATTAAVLDVQLRKPGAYVLNPDAGLPTAAEARRSVRLVVVAGALAVAVAGAVAWF
jgi:adenosylcobinamide-phosphate synthase